MKLGDYTFEQMPKPGWAPPIIKGRVQADPTYGGAVIHTSPGALSDEVYSLQFDALDGAPDKILVFNRDLLVPTPDEVTVYPGQAYGLRFPITAPDFRAVSAGLLYLRRAAEAAGQLSFEVWDRIGDLPSTKVGTLGLMDVADITADPGWTECHIASHLAFPLQAPGGYLVLNAALLTTNSIYVAGDVFGGTSGVRYIPGSGWQAEGFLVSGALWQGGQHCVLAGLAAAYSYPGGPGPLERTFTLDDEGYRRYLCFVAGFETGTELWSPGNEITFKNSVLDLMITGQVGEQGLAESA